MNLPSLDKYETLIKADGVLIVNTSLVDRDPEREDLSTVLVPANEIAEELGDKRMANLVMLGALVHKLDMLSIEDIGASLDRHIPEHRRNLLEGNLKALERGAALAMGEKLAT